jgi:integrase/recombinase XerC
VTQELIDIFESCDLKSRVPFLTQVKDRTRRKAGSRRKGDVLCAEPLRYELNKLRESIGITRKVTLHDMRRGTAVNLYRMTRNVRLVQTLLGHRSLPSTIWYLDNDLEPVEMEQLEQLKQPFLVRKEKSA